MCRDIMLYSTRKQLPSKIELHIKYYIPKNAENHHFHLSVQSPIAICPVTYRELFSSNRIL